MYTYYVVNSCCRTEWKMLLEQFTFYSFSLSAARQLLLGNQFSINFSLRSNLSNSFEQFCREDTVILETKDQASEQDQKWKQWTETQSFQQTKDYSMSN